jgi:hypothetical protein
MAVDLESDVPVRALQVTFEDPTGEFELVPGSAACTARTAGFVCDANEIPDEGRIELVLFSPSGATIPNGAEPVVTLDFSDGQAACIRGMVAALSVQRVLAAGLQNEPLAATATGTEIACGCGSSTTTPVPTTTTTSVPSAAATISVGQACAEPGSAGIVVPIQLVNDVAVRGLQLEMRTNDAPLVLAASACTARTPGFRCEAHQTAGTGVNVLILSTAGDSIFPGVGAVAQLTFGDPAPGCTVGQEFALEITGALAADADGQPLPIGIEQTGTFRCGCPGQDVTVRDGLNLVGLFVEPDPGMSASGLATALGGAPCVRSIARLGPTSGVYETLHLEAGGPAGIDFPLHVGTGLVVDMACPASAVIAGARSTSLPIGLVAGANLTGVPDLPGGYRAFDLLRDLGGASAVASVARLDATTARFDAAVLDAGSEARGVNFSIVPGEAYLVYAIAATTALVPGMP